MKNITFLTGYEVLQDVHGRAEERGILRPDFEPTVHAIDHCISEFEPLPYLAHLQVVFEKQPNYGRNLRFYNYAPWWYRLRFRVPENFGKHIVVKIGAADYYADVYLNGSKLGSHEGYYHSFEFNADGYIDRDGENTLLIKVSSPWDPEDLAPGIRVGAIKRKMIKGTYEHADSFGCRDVNPVGLWKPVELIGYDSARINGLTVRAVPDGNNGRVIAKVGIDGTAENVTLKVSDADTGETLKTVTGKNGDFDFTIENVKKWTSWERGYPKRYTVSAEIEDGCKTQRVSKTIGFRTVELKRDEKKTEYYLNGERIFIRGCSYLPDFYISRLTPEKVRRDVETMVAMGINMVRVHVHAQIPEFYEFCDELGLLVMQDNDLNWTFDPSDEFLKNCEDVFGQLIDYVGNHPCVSTLVCINEPNFPDRQMEVCPGPQLEEMARRLVPEIPVIRGSCQIGSLHSGDSHNYAGALFEHMMSYLDTSFRNVEKLNTEYGMDCPPVIFNLRKVPEILSRMQLSSEKSQELMNYQYRLLKWSTEYYRLRKYSPCAGYMQFLFCDPLPQSFFGVIDFWGTPKKGYLALSESNRPVTVILEADTESKAVWAINDTLKTVSGHIKITTVAKDGNLIDFREADVVVPADGLVRVFDYPYACGECRVFISFTDSDGELIAKNSYTDPTIHPAHPEGHPFYIDSEYSVPIYRTPKARK